MARILVIEDELPMRTALLDLLLAHDYRVVAATDGEMGLNRALSEPFDLLLLDVMMPKLDGFQLCTEVRLRQPEVPILMLTARGQVDDRVAGLDAGADDYLIKPFSSRELLARVRALLRRSERRIAPLTRMLLGDVHLDFVRRTCTRNGERIELTEKEYGILKLLAEHRGEPVSRERFLEVVWAYNAYPTTRTVDNQILSLRTKLEAEPARPRFILTVHGLGYRLEMTNP